MINIEQKDKCCGCSACATVCPKDSIKMIADEEGFTYPKVDKELCVQCGLCDNVCPITKSSSKNTIRATFAVKHIDRDVLEHSTSGGIFTALSDMIIRDGGAVYGAVLDEDMVVRHQRATNTIVRDRMRGSKYVQSDINGMYSRVKQDLTERKRVLFVGTPCQIDGLKCYLNGKTDGLVCCDLICHGTPSPLILKEHFDFLSKMERSKIKEYYWRPKRWGWHVHCEIAVFENGRKLHSTAYSDFWRNLYYSRMVTRPSCHNCNYTNLSRPGDITIGDCRGIDKICPDFGSYEGVSLVLINTAVGEEAFNSIKNCIVAKEIEIKDVMQPPLRESSKPSSLRSLFFDTYRKNGYKKAMNTCFGKMYRIKYDIKKILRRQ